jgi:hypothetical protein
MSDQNRHREKKPLALPSWSWGGIAFLVIAGAAVIYWLYLFAYWIAGMIIPMP